MIPLRLAFGQRVVIVVGLGAALAAVGDFITSLGGGYPSGWVGYAPMPLRVLGAPGMSAGPRLAVWLVVTALWVAVSLFILRERPVPGAPAGATPDTPAAAPGQPAAS